VVAVLSQTGSELKRSKYRLLGLVGQGQFGRVFCAVHRQTGRLVALKNLEHQRFPTHKFLRELRFLLSLQHENIVTCQALEHTRTGRYLVMDYCEGGTLRSLMNGDSLLNLPQSLKLVADILAGLDHAHSRGIVHCDIKPENILLNLQPSGWTARISDFGIARLSQELVERGMGNTGSPAYMAPERFYGQYSPTSDLYSVGILLFELITGYRPFSGSPAELMSAHLNHPLKLPDLIPPAWQPILITSLQKLSARRFRSAAEMLSALQTVAVEQGLGSLLDSQTTAPLLQPKRVTPVCSFRDQQCEPLPHPIAHLTLAPQIHTPLQRSHSIPLTNFCWTTGTQVAHQLLPADTLAGAGNLRQTWHTVLPSPVRDLWLCSQGCFAVTSEAVYFLPLFNQAAHPTPQLVTLPNQDFVAVGKGNWLATLTTSANTTSANMEANILELWQFSEINSGFKLSTQPIKLALQGDPSSIKLIALDARHLAVASNLQSRSGLHLGSKQSGQNDSATLLQGFTRRGDRVGNLVLSVPIGQVITTFTPYQLLTTDLCNPQSILLIDLKPFRIARLGVEIAPEFLLATRWGYILADRQGQILLLDREGQQISRVDGPPHITAIASSDQANLLVATWDGNQGSLHIVDLRLLDIDLLF
jgi:serine/threonine protein kinase